ncbi:MULTISPECIES: hypothetical protein [Halobacteriovorax]|uniref:Uncharacterized protein n=1 Tax=Halobacteriovorax vibrionivorans TaxID=2152716 RepID=A0ABY0II39_9BACT|nr:MULTISPECIES: hypothetical protein [Halobacteriovorax]AYF45549.1 hypothetical protein BALOs_2555 [Halobacteriovorax sp. BALOs_7]RZF22616.1 hypothetical protein DAY19_02255 [Halobacteriovorax vibrionivorans]TGD47836.1 hypothetical protein EP118_06350 [Halobacteriovorax sp. Y22]
MNKLVLAISLLYLSSQFSFARKPAVEDTFESSIEEYKEVEPSKAKGYDFSPARKPSGQKEERTHNSDLLKVESYTESKTSENLLYLFFILLPVFVSAYTFFRANKDSYADKLKTDAHAPDKSNVTSLADKREEQEKEDIKKAS